MDHRVEATRCPRSASPLTWAAALLALCGSGGEGGERRGEPIGRNDLERIIDTGSRHKSSGITVIGYGWFHAGLHRFHHAH